MHMHTLQGQLTGNLLRGAETAPCESVAVPGEGWKKLTKLTQEVREFITPPLVKMMLTCNINHKIDLSIYSN